MGSGTVLYIFAILMVTVLILSATKGNRFNNTDLGVAIYVANSVTATLLLVSALHTSSYGREGDSKPREYCIILWMVIALIGWTISLLITAVALDAVADLHLYHLIYLSVAGESYLFITICKTANNVRRKIKRRQQPGGGNEMNSYNNQPGRSTQHPEPELGLCISCNCFETVQE